MADMGADSIRICRLSGNQAPCAAPQSQLGACGTDASGELWDGGPGCQVSPLLAGECAVAWDTVHGLGSRPCCAVPAAPAPALSVPNLILAVVALGALARHALARRAQTTRDPRTCDAASHLTRRDQ
jgi:hypothetical protein